MNKWLGYWVLVLLFGSGFLFLDIAAQQISPLELTAIRMTIASLVLVVVVQATGQSLPRTRREWAALIGLGVVNYTIPFTLFTWAQAQGVDSGLVGVLSALSPLFTIVMAHFAFTDERMTVFTILGVVVGLAGTFILASRNLTVEGTLWGIGAVVLAALSLAASNVYSRVIMGDEESESDDNRLRLSPLVIGAGTSIGGAVVTGLLVLVSVGAGNSLSPYHALQSDVIFAVLTLSLVHSVVPSVLVRVVIRALGASVMSTVQYLAPVIALVLGVAFREEIIDGRVLLGTGVIFLGVAIANLGGRWLSPLLTRAAQSSTPPDAA